MTQNAGSLDRLVADKNYPWTLADLLPEILPVGTPAGTLTPAGAALLDPSGTLQPGAVFCPPEGDAGTGMVATNSVAPGTGNVSAGTSVFAMVVLDRPLAGCTGKLIWLPPLAVIRWQWCTPITVRPR